MRLLERLRGWLLPLRRRWQQQAGATVAVPATSFYGLLWVPVLALCLGGLLAISPLYLPLSNYLHDLAMRHSAQPNHFDDVAVIDIDDASLRELRPRLGGWPYSRDTFALLVDFLREIGTRQIILNLVLSEPRDGDAPLARTIAARSDVVLAAAGQDRADEPDPRFDPLRRKIAIPAGHGLPSARWGSIVLPDDILLAALARAGDFGSIGVVSTRLDPDGMLRRLSLLHEADGLIFPSMALAPTLLAASGSANRLKVEVDAVSFGRWRWPVNAAGQVTLAFPRNRDAVVRLPFSQIMAAALGLNEQESLRKLLGGRTVFVGSSAFLGDDVMTPLGRVSGTGVLACAHAALQRGDVFQPQAGWLTAVFAGIALSPSLWLWLRRRPALLSDALASLCALALLVAAGLLILSKARIDVELLVPLAIVVSGFLIAAMLQLRWFGHANRQLRLERAVAEAANQAKSEFLANVSHEIRTPMNALLGVAELLQRTPLNEEQRRYVCVFQRSGQTLFELINDLLDLSKIEAGRIELEPQPFSLKSMLADQYQLFKAKAIGKGLELDWVIADDLPPMVLGDRRRLAQVLTNLLGNAIKFTQAGRVSLRVESTDAGIRFEIGDTGIGIGADQHERIFQPFIQADGSLTRSFGGTGLGLSIAGGLVKQMGGAIHLSSDPGVGSTFSFCIQLPAVDVEDLEPAPQQGEPKPNPVTRGQKPFRILLTEDNEINVLLVEAMLQDTDSTLEVASDGESALAMFRSGSYDLILMDVQMPGIDGHQTTREIRRIEAAENRRPVVVIALTAHAFERDIQRSLEAGCNAHLTKPVSRVSLLAAIRQFRNAEASVDSPH